MSWKITKDFIASTGEPEGTNQNAVNLTGPRNFDPSAVLKHKFRMYDDDGEPYYEGFCCSVSDEPLSNFGMPNAGCTRIKFLNGETKEWELL